MRTGFLQRRLFHVLPGGGCAAVLILAALVLAGAAAPEPAPEGTEIKVERVPPVREKLSTLRFLRENRDFIRARLDRLREKPVGGDASAPAIDPRFLAYQGLLAEVRVAQDTVAAVEDARARQHLLESITELGDLEARLGWMERLVVEQRNRLMSLESDFTGDQRTTLMIVVSGYPSDAAVEELAITIADGDTLHVPLSAEQRESLKRGGILEAFHGFVEPREQVVQVTIRGNSWPAGDSGFITLGPARDRLTFLKLDLSTIRPARGAASIRATTWLHEGESHSAGG